MNTISLHTISSKQLSGITVVFVHGCFWHGHPNCKHFVMSKSNTEYWKSKINSNIASDKITYESLSKLRWNVLVVWECKLKKDKRESTLERLYSDILKNAKQ